MEREYMKGGEFLIADNTASFHARRFYRRAANDRRDTREFVDNEVVPNLPAMEGARLGGGPRTVKKGGRTWA